MYADVVEQLVANHLQKDDNMSALITAEWYMRPKHFPGWGRPYEFAAGLYRRLGRMEESRDSVSTACLLLVMSQLQTCFLCFVARVNPSKLDMQMSFHTNN